MDRTNHVPTWRKSSYSGGTAENCIEVASMPGGTAVRDSKQHRGPIVTVPSGDWAEFIGSIKAGTIG